MEFRHSLAHAAEQITLDQFAQRVRAGSVAPTALYREPWTFGEWRTVNNHRVFHANSPVAHPLGSRLADAERAKQREAELEQRVHSDHGRMTVEDDSLVAPPDTYSDGTLIEDALLLRPMRQLLAEPGVLGVSRFFLLPAFEPERVATVTFRPDHLDVTVTTAASQIWFLLFRGPVVPAELPPPTSRSATLPYRRAPHPFGSWDEFARVVAPLPSCRTDTLDGIGYRHKLAHPGGTRDVQWDNPDDVEHPGQVALVAAYKVLLKKVA